MNRTKYYMWIVVMCFATICFGQSKMQQIKFELYLVDSCQNTVSKEMFYTLSKNGKHFYSTDEDGILFLKEKGIYELSTLHDENLKKYTFNTFENFVDTLAIETIRECYSGGTNITFWGYCCCGEKCEEEQTSYYANGNIHIKGNFKKGIPIGKVKTYYENGNIMQVRQYNKKGEQVRTRNYKQKN